MTEVDDQIEQFEDKASKKFKMISITRYDKGKVDMDVPHDVEFKPIHKKRLTSKVVEKEKRDKHGLW